MTATAEPGQRSASPDRDSWSEELDGLDLAVYHVTIPRTTSFPSGHAASASAFATGVATASPEAGILISAAAALVAYP